MPEDSSYPQQREELPEFESPFEGVIETTVTVFTQRMLDGSQFLGENGAELEEQCVNAMRSGQDLGECKIDTVLLMSMADGTNFPPQFVARQFYD
jgi:hypothetical protein